AHSYPLPKPTINMSPDAKTDQVVGLPTWLWVNPGLGAFPDRVDVGTVSVTSTVRADTVTFDMGDGSPTFQCIGADATTDPTPSGPSKCSHTYTRSSAPRSDHVGDTYTVTATVIW